MATDVRFVNFLDGEGASHTDMNAFRDYMRALEGDMRLGALLHMVNQQSASIAVPKTTALYASGLGAAPVPSGTNLQINNVAGPVHQNLLTTEPDGATPQLLTYWVEANELQTTLGAGDATNPRIDLIEVKLEVVDESESRDFMDASGIVSSTTGVTRKKIQLTKNTKVGTPAATPAAPSVTAGYVPWCYVWVPATYASTFGYLHIWDFRYPLGYSRPLVAGPGMYSSAWTYSAGGGTWSSSAGSQALYVPVPSMNTGARLLSAVVISSANVDLKLIEQIGGTDIVSTQTATQTLSIPLGTSANSATKPGAVWLNTLGTATPTSIIGGSPINTPMALVITSTAGSQTVRAVHFEIAG